MAAAPVACRAQHDVQLLDRFALEDPMSAHVARQRRHRRHADQLAAFDGGIRQVRRTQLTNLAAGADGT
ncbi:MAG: hypothetical protein HND48_19245 [Chloroflexi bacterium]|nr:hypothetical protein [Chloroflexota bacterium]